MYSRNYTANPQSHLPPNYHGSVFPREQQASEQKEDSHCEMPDQTDAPCACSVKPPCMAEKKPFLSDDLILYGLLFLMLTGNADFKQNDHLLLMSVLAYIVLF